MEKPTFTEVTIPANLAVAILKHLESRPVGEVVKIYTLLSTLISNKISGAEEKESDKGEERVIASSKKKPTAKKE